MHSHERSCTFCQSLILIYLDEFDQISEIYNDNLYFIYLYTFFTQF